MFDTHGDDVLALALIEVRRTLDRQVIRFGRTGSPDDLFGIGIHQRRNLRARQLDGFFRLPTIVMGATRGIAKFLGQIGDHLGSHTRIDRSGC